MLGSRVDGGRRILAHWIAILAAAILLDPVPGAGPAIAGADSTVLPPRAPGSSVSGLDSALPQPGPTPDEAVRKALGVVSPSSQTLPDLAQSSGKKSSSKKSSAKSSSKKKSSKKKPSNPWRFKGSLGLDFIYDDNVFRFSDINIDEFRRNANPEKFKLDTYDDFILSPSLTMEVRRKFIADEYTSLWVKYQSYQYTSNPDKTNENWYFRLRQYLWGSDFCELTYSYTPWSYIRELTDRPPFTSRAVPLEYKPFKSTRSALKLGYWKRVHSRLLMRGEVERIWRYYNRPFLENDNWEWAYSAIGYIDLTKVWSCRAEYTYSDVKGREGDTVGETLENTDNGDSSYERDYYNLELRFRPKKGFLWIFEDASTIGKHMKYFYTSELPEFIDPFHTGRIDEINSIEALLFTKKLYGPVTSEIGYRFSRRSSTAAYSETGAGNIEEDKNYVDNRTWIAFSYPF